ncbi:MAG: YncE family protein [Flavobacteriia bacterium]|nr:YncE family protein [Flavobacteriia bacterium]
MKKIYNNVKFTLSGLLWSISILSISACHKQMCKRKIHEEIFVANEEEGTITIIDAQTFKELDKTDLKHKGSTYMVHNVQAAPDGRSVWATGVPENAGDDEMVIVLKGKKNKTKEYINVGNDQHLAHVVLDEKSKYAYVSAKEKGQIIQIDVEKAKETKRFDLGETTGPHGMRYLNGKLYVACMSSKEMIILDVSTGALTHIPVDGIAVQTAVLPTIESIFISVYDLKKVVRYDLTTGDTININLPATSQGPIQLYPSPDNQKVYVCDQGIVGGNPVSNKLYVINTNTNLVEATITVGNGAHGVTTNSDGTKIFVTNLSDNSVSVVDANTLSVIQTLSVGVSPNGISLLKCD